MREREQTTDTNDKPVIGNRPIRNIPYHQRTCVPHSDTNIQCVSETDGIVGTTTVLLSPLLLLLPGTRSTTGTITTSAVTTTVLLPATTNE